MVSWSLVKKIGESLGLVKLRLARKLQSLVDTEYFSKINEKIVKWPICTLWFDMKLCFVSKIGLTYCEINCSTYQLRFFCQIAMCSFSHLTNFLLYRYATVEQAVKALKIDILRTFKARLEMHCDSLVGDEIQAQWSKINNSIQKFNYSNLPNNRVGPFNWVGGRFLGN